MEGAATNKAVYPSAVRNKQPILDILQHYMPVGTQGLKVLTVLENGGEHVSFFATACPEIQFLPTTPAPELLGSIHAYCEGLPNVQPAMQLNTRQEDWRLATQFDAIITINIVQSVEWEDVLGLLQGAAKYLVRGGWLFIYGPFLKGGQYMSAVDEADDMSIRIRNPDWGYRDLTEVVATAGAQGLRQEAVHDMPANNFTLVFVKG